MAPKYCIRRCQKAQSFFCNIWITYLTNDRVLSVISVDQHENGVLLNKCVTIGLEHTSTNQNIQLNDQKVNKNLEINDSFRYLDVEEREINKILNKS